MTVFRRDGEKVVVSRWMFDIDPAPTHVAATGYNGKVDRWRRNDAKGVTERLETDHNADEKADRFVDFDDGKPARFTQDTEHRLTVIEQHFSDRQSRRLSLEHEDESVGCHLP